MGKTGWTVWGVILIVAGLALLAARLSSGAGGVSLVVPGLLVVLGVARIVRAGGAQVPSQHVHSSQSEGRDGPPDSTPQIAGRKCAHCDVKIASVMEGTFCKKCDVVLHSACLEEHRAKAHRTQQEAPYR